ncbi:Loki-CTERM sorting domain-containing protein [Geobacillus sp. FSL W8-0032]|uniref:Magnesium and cobalt transport protein CorA n=1 Tax=Geobacillus subterraneus TaxID=129338 RepID=A0A679FPB2_9BACL|nr:MULTISPECIES: Loki-CTERM sorting domain-containing protein [Geobacillus]KYD27911.1 hypothetical protein B4113_4128 [Geobacillus sp. B4113_201601]BBW96077.1 hypothetical protein GsuE55_09100 [Geobacillus subterraneus]
MRRRATGPCWLHFTAASQPDLERLLSSWSLHPFAQKRLIDGTDIPTVESVIFLPMMFMASVYGMNFTFMPELKWRYGYPLALLLMATVAALIALYFKRKGWWGETGTTEK